MLFQKNIVSVIIPVFKVEKYIEECIKSVIHQTYRHLEIIVVDDASPDRSIDICRRILATQDIPWTILAHEKNRGLSAARNTGVRYAKGEFLFFLDSDDYISHECISLMLNKARSTSAEMVFGNIARFFDVPDESVSLRYEREVDSGAKAFSAYMKGDIYVMACNRLIKHSFYHQNSFSFIEGILHEDEPWAFTVALALQKYAIVYEVTYYYRQSNNSITHKKFDFERLHGLLAGVRFCIHIAVREKLQNDVMFRSWCCGRIFWILHNMSLDSLSCSECHRLCTELLAIPWLPIEEMLYSPAFRLAYKLRRLFRFCDIYMLIRALRRIALPKKKRT